MPAKKKSLSPGYTPLPTCRRTQRGTGWYEVSIKLKRASALKRADEAGRRGRLLNKIVGLKQQRQKNVPKKG